MFLLAIVAILLGIGYIVPSLDTQIALHVIAAIAAIVEAIALGANYYGQIENIEKIKECAERKVVHQKKAEILTAEFIKYLSEKYLEHEKEVLKRMTPDNVSVYVAKYPEIKASETLTELVKKINKLQTAIYDEDLNVARMNRKMRVRSRNLWIIPFVMPKR